MGGELFCGPDVFVLIEPSAKTPELPLLGRVKGELNVRGRQTCCRELHADSSNWIAACPCQGVQFAGRYVPVHPSALLARAHVLEHDPFGLNLGRLVLDALERVDVGFLAQYAHVKDVEAVDQGIERLAKRGAPVMPRP